MTPTSQRRLNHLAGESSPYLLQHADNPVDWRPWGPEALEIARREERPIFLSIGYAACHWCHVMEHESFEDPSVAALLNAHFVPVKVDREERPDIDAVYMAAVQALTGAGGWPLSVFLTPDLRPFFGGTYFPPEPRWGRPSFTEVLRAIADAWQTRRPEVERGAAELVQHLRSSREAKPDPLDVPTAHGRVMATLSRAYDPTWGGFGSAPKFPTPARLFYLLERAAEGDDAASRLLRGTLDGMAAGGMWDWVGGGFHRYSVDAMWLVPHFEKMLYDNALLARLYGEAGVRIGEPRWTDIARRTADYLLDEMRGPEGAFLSSTDADSEGEEGRFFTWTADEVRAALPAEEAEAVVGLCRLDGQPNFEGGRSVLRPAPERVSRATLEAAERGRRRLYGARARRVPPATDDKRLAAWNGMAVWALAWLGPALEEPRYVEAARLAARHVLEAMPRREGRLTRSWRNGRLAGAETLEDLAWVSAGLTQLYQADGDPTWLAAAVQLVGARLPHYLGEGGQLFDAPDDGESLPVRPRDPADGALPASGAVMVDTLLRLAALTGDTAHADTARAAIAADAVHIERAPEAFTSLLLAASRAARPPVALVVVGDPAAARTRELVRVARTARTPPDVLAVSQSPVVPASTLAVVPLFEGRDRVGPGEAVAFLCVGGACRLPTTDATELARLLEADR